MSLHAGNNDPVEDPFDQILAEYLQAADSGHPPDQQAFIARHPQFAGELREFFASQERFEDAARPFRFEALPAGQHSESALALASAALHEGDATVGNQTLAVGVSPGERIRYFGEYELLEEIARGGMGVVFKAKQVRLNRIVALKMILAGRFASSEDIKRFQIEAENAAQLDHPNIAPIYEVGKHKGQHYFTMKLVEGSSLSGRAGQFAKNHKAAVAMLTTVARAVDYAHQRGILHRDIKPGNILIDSSGQPQVTDFGLARRLETTGEEASLTLSGAIIGSPSYMAPEQARGEKGLTVAADVYALGAVLYEWLTGKPPFSGPNTFTVLEQVRTSIPARPSSVNAAVGRDLEVICLKCLDKEPHRRYASARALAEDLERWSRGEPIAARPASSAERAWRWGRRKPTAAALVLVSTVAVATAIVGLAVSNARIRAQRIEAVQATIRAVAAEGVANEQMVHSALAQARGGRTSIAAGRRFEGLSALAVVAKIRPSAMVRSQAVGCLALADARVLQEWRGGVGICFNHACDLFAERDSNMNVLIFHVPGPDGKTGLPMLRLPNSGPGAGRLPPGFGGSQVAFSPDDRLVAVSGTDGHKRVYSLDGRMVIDIPIGPACDFTPDGAGFAAASPGGPIVIYDLHSGKSREQVKCDAGDSLSFSPDGGRIATWNSYEGTDITVGALASGEFATLPHPAKVFTVAWHPDGTRLAVAASDSKIYQWDVAQIGHPLPLPTLTGHNSDVYDVKFNHGGDLLASSSWDDTTRLWDATSSEPLVRIAGGGNLSFNPDDKRLTVTGSASARYQVMEVASGRERRTFLPPPGHRGREAVFSSDGLIMASVGMNTVRFWDLSDFAHYVAPLDLPLPDWGRSAALYPDGTGLFVSTNSGLWQTSITDQVGHQMLPDGTVVRQRLVQPTLTKLLDLPTLGDGKIQCSADGRFIAVAQHGQQPRVVNLDDPRHPTLLTSAPSTTAYISISHDRKWVATGTWGSPAGEHVTHVTVCDARNGHSQELPVPYDANVAFSPDNRWLVTCTCQEYRFWEVGSWRPRHGVTRNANIIGGIAFSPDSRTVAISPGRYGVRLIDADSGNEIVTFDDFDEEMPVSFSPDGGQLATFRLNGTFAIRLWDIRRIRQELGEMGLDWAAQSLPPRTTAPRIDLSLATPSPPAAAPHSPGTSP